MVSDTIRNLARQFASWRDGGGVRLDTAACELAESQLSHCAELVAGMEGQPVPPRHRGGTLYVIQGGQAAGGAA
jgi:hypothetical protein